MSELYFYSTPAEAKVVLTLDNGLVIEGVPVTANGRGDAHKIILPPRTPTQGGFLGVSYDGYTSFSGRGIVLEANIDTGADPQFIFDDVHLVPLPPPPALPPKPNPNLNPFDVTQAVYDTGQYDLSTKEGCGEYTEACCLELFIKHARLWAHIRKEPAQNQWAGHAVDAIQLFVKAGGTDPGIYDIIWSTESPEAKPAWSYKGPPDPNLWMSPIV